MAYLPESDEWPEGVYRLERKDKVEGGINGVSNKPLRNLADRTYFLKKRAEELEKKADEGIKATNYVRAASGAGIGLLPKLMGKLTRYAHGKTGQAKFMFYGFGSSVGNVATVPDKDTNAPIAKFYEFFNRKINLGGIYPIAFKNHSVDGSTVDRFDSAWTTATADGTYPDLALLIYGMNDFSTAQYNAGQTFGNNGFTQRIRNLIRKIKEAGGDVVLTTTPHPHSKRVKWSMPSGIDQSWPVRVSAPVSDADIVPSANESIVTVDWRGVQIPASVRYLRGNDDIRKIATEMKCLLIDIETYWFDAVAQYGEDALFDEVEVVHPNKRGHELSFWRGFEDFFENCRGNGYVAPDAGHDDMLTVGGSSLYPQPTRADIDLMANGTRENAFAVRDQFSRAMVRRIQDGTEIISGYSSSSPTGSAPGYNVTMTRKLIIDRGLFQNGSFIDIPLFSRATAKIFIEAFSGNRTMWAQASELMVSNREGVVAYSVIASIDTTGTTGGIPDARLFKISTIAGALRITAGTDNTVLKIYFESFGS
ncbi:MAG TPA: SGNH/GDSL hydrolase family protein [Serratia grimesii]|uniref:SGNH/GDSL hydrolase family protein n=1 Tax=Serratia grimesii TaxID=82995 RepID=A0A9C7QT47_9GAMM|nr:GDSL-type esterase/lipase family protein [Serratia grimesii]HCJ98947.1 SGNH/GDSL hydrolase family protein [Serratia grimesii]